jgi:hypothetical protein
VNSRSEMRRLAVQAPDQLIAEIERLRAENEILNGRIPAHLSPARILAMRDENERLRARVSNLHAVAIENHQLREALERAINFINAEPQCNITRRQRCDTILRYNVEGTDVWPGHTYGVCDQHEGDAW